MLVKHIPPAVLQKENTATTDIAYTQNDDRRSKGDESDTASAVICTYKVKSWVVVLKRPSDSPVNWLLWRYLEDKTPSNVLKLYNAVVHKDISKQQEQR